MDSIFDTWQRLEDWLGRNFPPALADLNAGCEESLLIEVEEKLNVDLPLSLKDVYRLHDGQKTTDLSQVGIFYGVSFLPLKQIVRAWESWVETNELIERDGYRQELDEFQESFAPEKLKSIYSNDKWIPFAIIAESSYLGLDYDPAAKGVIGQVINVGRDEEQKTVLANSFEEFLESYVSELERGNFIIDENNGWVEFLPKDLSHRVLNRRSKYLGSVATRFIQ